MERLPPAKFHPDRFARLKALGAFLLAASFFIAAVLFLTRLSGNGPSGGGSLETSPVTLNGETEQNRAAAVALIPSTRPSSGNSVKPVVSTALIAAVGLDAHSPLGDPLTIARAIPSVDPRLVEWLSQSQSAIRAGHSIKPADRDVLASILKNAQIPALTLFQLGKSFSLISKDTETTAVFYEAAVTRGHEELSQFSPGSADAKPILIAMHDSKPALWLVVESTRDQPPIDAMVKLSNDLIKFILPTDAEFQNIRVHGYISLAECATLEGDFGGALSIVQPLQSVQLSEEQQNSFAWTEGLALVGLSRFTDAIAPLQAVASHPGKNKQFAMRLLVRSYCEAGRGADAEAAFEEYKQQFHPAPSEVGGITGLIAEAKYNEQYINSTSNKGGN